MGGCDGAPWGIRTLDLEIRSLLLYPAELRAHMSHRRIIIVDVAFWVLVPHRSLHREPAWREILELGRRRPSTACARSRTGFALLALLPVSLLAD